jgi:hypothetical protein
MLVLWVVTQCGLAGRFQRFGGTYCLNLQGVTTQNIDIDIFDDVLLGFDAV